LHFRDHALHGRAASGVSGNLFVTARRLLATRETKDNAL